jgi:hypothetical protein
MKSKITSTTSALVREIAGLGQATPADLKKRWRVLYRTEPPRRISRDLLIRALAYRIQERTLYVTDVVEPSTDVARQAGAALGPRPRLAAKVAAPSQRSSPNGCKGRKSRIARLGKQRDEVR